MLSRTIGDRCPEDVAIVPAREDDASAWNAYVSSAPGATAYHRFEWSGVLRDVYGHHSHYLMAVGPGGAIVGVLPLIRVRSRLFGDFLVSMPFVNYGGPLGATAAVAEELLNHATRAAERLGVQQLELRSRSPLSSTLQGRSDKVTLLMDLPRSPEILWERLSSKVRAQVRRPQKEGAHVVTGGAELARGFFSVFSRNMRDLGTPVHSERFFDAIARALPQHARITLVILSGDAVAAGLSFRHAHGTEVAWASSVRSFNRFAVNMLLYWELLRQAMASGSACFDFGRSTIDSGPFRFKKQWGARAEPLHYAYWTRSGGRPDLLSPASPKYRLAVHAWRHLPLSLTRAIGPRIVKYLP